jgi:predicted O-linked N-acetylglucosamine transferase (SPINDLY family)
MSLRERLRASPLMDERRFTRALEWLYAQAWERWRNP